MAKNSNMEKQYAEIKKKYNLPEFVKIDKELELSDLEDTNFLLRAIIRRIAEKLDFCATLLEEILQPDTSSLYAIHETRAFDEDEKKRMYDLYSRLMSYSRHSIEVSLSLDEAKSSEFISSFVDEWEILREEIMDFVKQMRESWKIEADIKEDLGYLG